MEIASPLGSSATLGARFWSGPAGDRSAGGCQLPRALCRKAACTTLPPERVVCHAATASPCPFTASCTSDEPPPAFDTTTGGCQAPVVIGRTAASTRPSPTQATVALPWASSATCG